MIKLTNIYPVAAVMKCIYNIHFTLLGQGIH